MQHSADRSRRFFISYRRRATADARLAEFLRGRLTAEGSEVFVDVSMPVGIDWSAEIERRIVAAYSRAREQQLAGANLGLEKLRFLLRTCMGLRYLDPRRYEHAARSVGEVGRLVGGWIKANRAAQA